ncbi:hypothetical protein Vadar_019035 [Vaccinium darrowii]|uniref:Uncharacterized protein n=1 Tax=Vaccinium darrowii TaxID=229202 RepID=A0ACB7YEM5_9ERIC|nr:hypothetical protein Vadar_019035 [Vaccinium darrowii]
MAMDLLCVLRASDVESHGHLLFSCPFASQIWSILQKFKVCRSLGNWDHEICWATLHLKQKGFLSVLYKLALASYVYYIWKTMNEYVFGNKIPNLEGILEQLDHDVRDRVCTWGKVGGNSVNRDLCRAWNISGKAFGSSLIAMFGIESARGGKLAAIVLIEIFVEPRIFLGKFCFEYT